VSGTVGRDGEVAAVRRALRETADGAGGCLLFTGPPGIGKSHLLRTATEYAGSLQVAVASREAFKLDLAAPLVTLAGALRNCRPATTEFDWLSERPVREDHYRTLERLRAGLENFAARRPLLICIDDAHWMDELSALAVRELVPALASSPVRWLFAGRPVTPDTPGHQTLAWLAHSGAETMPLSVLDDAAITQLCTGVAGAEVDNTVLALAAACGGNPLRIEKLLTALRVTGQLLISGGVASVVGSELPSSFIDTVRDVLDSLPPDAQWVVRAGSVFARPFSVEAVARLVSRPPAELFPLIERALGDFLAEESDGLTFAHDLVRQAVYSTLPRSVGEQLHRDAAAVAQDEGRPALEVAEHLLHSGRAGAPEAVALLRAAAKQVAGTAPATAATLMMHALDSVGAHSPERAVLIAEAVGLLASAARLDEARELGEEALRADLGGETDALVLLGLAEAFKHAGQNRTAVRYADRGLADTGISPAIRARLYAIRAHALFYVDDFEQADRSGAESDRLGRASREYGASVFGLTARSLVAHAEGRLDDALAHAATATELADHSGGEALHRHPRIWLGSAQATLDRFDAAEQTFRHGREESERFGTAWAQPLFHYYYANLLTAQGLLDDAVAEADAGVETAELTAYQLAVPLLGTLIRLAVLRGETAQAQEHQARMRALIGTGITAPPEDVDWPEALLLHASGADGAALTMLSGLYDVLPTRPGLIGHDPAAAAGLTGIALAAGDPGRAALVVDAAGQLARNNPKSHSAAGAAAHADGLLRGDLAQLLVAVDRFRATPRRLALAAALEDAAVVGHTSADPAPARAWYDEALTIMTECGAAGSRQRLEERLGGWRGTVVPVPKTQPPPCLPQLSAAERKVALLVAKGMTNIEVAEHLYLSRHTVDSHLRKIFWKLKINRRVELASLVARECSGNPGIT
jgi:DNA-binding CsgD family transcriptional regulator/tetratricopeptide (TPR) repeat protein